MSANIPSVIVEAPTPAPAEQGIETFIPIQWEDQRVEVRRAMVEHRYASLKIRQLSREQYAIDWASMPGTLWSRPGRSATS